MPKYKRKKVDRDEYLLRKIKKLERKIAKRCRRSYSSSSENSNFDMSLQDDYEPEELKDVPDTESVNNATQIQSSPPDNPLPSESIIEKPSTSAESSNVPITLDDDLLDLLGKTPTDDKSYGPPIQAELAVRWEHISTKGLSKELKKDIVEKYSLPENCLKIGSPKLNPEIKAAMSDILVKKDKTIEFRQNQQAVAITCISQALTAIFASQHKDSNIIKLLLDAGKFLCDSQYNDSIVRRNFVLPTIKKEISQHLFATEIDSFLFGENVADMIKTAKVINRSGAEMKTASQVKSFLQNKFNQPRPLNSRLLLPLTRQMGAGRKSAAQQPRSYQAPPQKTALPQQNLPLAQPQRSRGPVSTRR